MMVLLLSEEFRISKDDLATASYKVYQLLVHGRWFSPGTPASSTTKAGRHDIAEMLLKVTLDTKKTKDYHRLPNKSLTKSIS